MPRNNQADKKKNKSEPIEATLWQSADKLRKSMDAAEYKHVVLGLTCHKNMFEVYKRLGANHIYFD